MLAKLAELERRVSELESNRGASFRFAEVASVDEKTGTARVKLPDGDDLVSMPLRVSQRRTLKDQSQELPDVGEHVACIFTGQGLEDGAIMGAVYSEKDGSPGRPSHCWYNKFEDGTEIEYDRKTHKLTAKVKGSVEVESEKEVKVKTDTEVEVVAATEVKVKAATQVTIEGANQINLATPALSIGGLEGGSCKATMRVDIHHIGQYLHQGDYLHNGNNSQTGSHNLTGSLAAGGDVTAKTVLDKSGNTNHHSH